MTALRRPQLDPQPRSTTPMRAFKTESECRRHAEWCERMAADAEREADRQLLLATAAHWRTLAEHAKE